MAVFYDTGGGDIYGGPDKESIIEAMREDGVFEDYDESDIEEVDGTYTLHVTDENDEPTDDLITLDDEYDESLGAYCIASSNG